MPAGLEVVLTEEVAPTRGYVAPGHEVDGEATSRLVSPADFPLWLVRAELAPGAALTWSGAQGDEALYVQSGEVDVDGRTCPTGGTAVVEAGVEARAVARGPATVLHFGSFDPTPPTGGLNGPADPEGHSVHVVGPRGTYAMVSDDRDTHYYADSTCPTCRLTLLYTSRTTPYTSSAHSHSVDELIHILWGEIHFGRQRLGPGATLAIAADRRYGFTGGPDGFGFLNYRRDASQQTVGRSDPPRLEGGVANKLEPVMDLR